jgi:multiple sugar transport system permease protein
MTKQLAKIWRGPAVLAVPACAFLIAFAVYPLATTVVYSFRHVTISGLLTGDMAFVGVDNFADAFRDPLLAHSTWLAVVFTVSCVAAQFVVGFALALLLNQSFRGRGVLRGLLMLPWVLPIVVIGATFKWMFQSSGLVNTVIGSVDPQWQVGWLQQATPAMITIIIANIWLGFPFAMSNLLTGLQTIPVPVLEAARIDGASTVQRFFQIVLPLMKAPILILLTLQLIFTFNVFELILVITGGGPANATSLITYFDYQLGFQYFNLGEASAVTVLMLVVLAAVSALYIRLATSEEARA